LQEDIVNGILFLIALFVMPFVSFQGKKVHYVEAGKGPVVVLLHGFLESIFMWENFVELWSENYHIIAIDLPGHGQSEVLDNIQSMELIAEAVNEVVQKLTDEPVALVGHSMGGYVSLAFADLFPKRVKGICMFHSTALEDSPAKKKDRERAVKVIRMNPAVFINEAIPNLFAPGNMVRLGSEIDLLKKEALKTPIEGITSCLLGMRDRSDKLEMIEKVDFPVLFVIGKEDPIIPYEKMLVQMNASKYIEALVLENVGHMGFIEAEKETREGIERFLEKTSD
jgi:pimeloyl-ACP methyl ester carboxylesterase